MHTGSLPGIGTQRIVFQCVRFLIGVAALLSLAGCANQRAISLECKPRSGYVRMTQVQAAYIGSGNAGSGLLYYQGGRYPFSVGGLGVGGIGFRRSKRGAMSTAYSI